MKNNIKIKIERDGKIVSEKEVKLKTLNLDDEADLKDLYIDHYQDIYKNKATSQMYRKSLNVIRKVTDYTDDEIRELSDAEQFQLFSIIGSELFDKKK